MKQTAIYIAFALLLTATSCKRCFTCVQHCTYCIPYAKTGIIVKVCTSGSASNSRVDSVMNAMNADTIYKCHLLDDLLDVCDNKNQADEAAAYYQKQDYFCVEKTQ